MVFNGVKDEIAGQEGQKSCMGFTFKYIMKTRLEQGFSVQSTALCC